MLNESSQIEILYQDVRARLIKLAVEASKSLTIFALVEEMVELQAQFCFSMTELQHYSDEVLSQKCHLLYRKLLEFHSDLTDYDISGQKLECLDTTIEDFKNVTAQLALIRTSLMENEPA